MRIILFVLFIVFGFISANADIIDTVIFAGNLKTKDKYLQKVIAHIPNTEYSSFTDTLVFNALERTKLFSEIAVIPSKNQKGNVSIFVILKERKNFNILGGGLSINDMEFGESSGTWAILSIDAYYNNFLGVNQRLRWRAQLWRDRFFGMDWRIPVGASPYFFEVGALVGRRPSLVWNWEISPYFNTNLVFGRFIGENQVVSLETSPQYRKYNNVYKSSGEWKTFESNEFWEIHQKLYYRFSIHDNNYPPLFASFASIALSTNKIMAYEDIGFWEISSDLKQNIPISQKAKHSFFLRFRPKLTISGRHNSYNGILTGGQDYIRGWGNDVLGSKEESGLFNNLLIGTAEYQFHIFTFPTMKFKWLSWFDASMSGFAPQVFGALFFDGGYLFEDIDSPVKSQNIKAASAGIAIRVLQNHMRLGAEIDLAWQLDGNKKYLNKNRGAPVLHLGIVSHF